MGNGLPKDARVFPGGQIMVEIEGNRLSYMPGEYVKGMIFVNQQQPFPSTMLELKLMGREFTHFISSNGKTCYPVKTENIICDISWPIAMSPGQVAQPGQYAYPFSVQIPDWLPNSMAFCPKKNNAMSIPEVYADHQFFLLAQFVPMDKDGLMYEKNDIVK